MNDELEKLFNEVGKYLRPKKEKTLFALGGRGHYENPVSDLLAFFLDPSEVHGLGSLFLRTFLECLSDEKLLQLSLDGVSITREESTDHQKRIDLVVRGSGWMLLIENKIYHWLANPLDDYETYFTQQNQGTELILAILSPRGHGRAPKWNGVSYKNYCNRLDHHLHLLQKNNILSKWMIFARELILHLENELYTKPMEEDAVKFVEENWKQLKQCQQLTDDYQSFLHKRLPELLHKALNDPDAYCKKDSWCIRLMGSRWREANIAWTYPAEHPGEIFLRVYFNKPNDHQLQIAREEFETKDMPQEIECSSWYKWQSRNFLTRAEAEKELIELAKVIERMMGA